MRLHCDFSILCKPLSLLKNSIPFVRPVDGSILKITNGASPDITPGTKLFWGQCSYSVPPVPLLGNLWYCPDQFADDLRQNFIYVCFISGINCSFRYYAVGCALCYLYLLWRITASTNERSALTSISGNSLCGLFCRLLFCFLLFCCVQCVQEL